MNQNSTLEKSTYYVALVLAFLMPIFYLPITTEFFEFNKLTLLTLTTVVLLTLWAIRLLTTKKVIFVKSPLNLPLMLMGGVIVLSSIFSLSQYISIFGKYGRWSPSLFSYSIVIAFFYTMALSNATKKWVEKILIALVAGITLSSVVALLSYFGINLISSTYAQSANFTLTGSTTTTALIAAVAMIIALNQLLNTEATLLKVVWMQVLMVNSIIIGLYNTLPAWVFLLVGAAVLLVQTKRDLLKKNNPFLLATLGIVSAIILVVSLPQTREVIKNENFSRESVLSFTDSWIVSSSTVTDFPLLGSGAGTFSLNYNRYRPVRLNSTDLWNARFDKPFNEVFNVMGTLGIIGIVVFAFLLIRLTRFALRNRTGDENESVSIVLGSIIVGLVVGHFFTYATVLNNFILFLSLGLLTSIYALNNKRGDSYVEMIQLSLSSLSSIALIGSLTESSDSRKRETFQYLAIIPLIAFAGAVSYYTYKAYAGEYYLRKSIEAALVNDGTQTYENQRKAINYNPQRAEYRNTYAQTNLLLAGNLAKKENLTDAEKQTIQTLIAQAIREVRLSTEAINPLAVGSWEVRAGVYKSLIGVAENADQWALGAYNTAIQLDPTNPRLRLEAGGVYYLQKDYLSAANLFRQATNLKADYANAHYNLAQSLKQLNNYALAQRELELTAKLINQESEDYKKVQDEIAEVANLTAGQEKTNPTVEDLDQQAQIEQQGTVTQQENLTKPDAVETIQGTNAPEVKLNETTETNETLE